MPIDPETIETPGASYVLPHYLRYARALALLSGAAVGIAMGAAVMASSGCQPVCSPGCAGAPGIGPMFVDGSADPSGDDAAAPPDAGSGDTGGGPRPAPVLPPAWIA
jgi:hypothetical protein